MYFRMVRLGSPPSAGFGTIPTSHGTQFPPKGFGRLEARLRLLNLCVLEASVQPCSTHVENELNMPVFCSPDKRINPALLAFVGPSLAFVGVQHSDFGHPSVPENPLTRGSTVGRQLVFSIRVLPNWPSVFIKRANSRGS